MSRLCYHNFWSWLHPVSLPCWICLFTVFTTFYDPTPDPWTYSIAMATRGDLPDDFPRISEEKLLPWSQISSDRQSSSGDRCKQSPKLSSKQLFRDKGHRRWFPGWTLRTANKTQPRVTDLDSITTTDEKCWEIVLDDTSNCLLHDTFIHPSSHCFKINFLNKKSSKKYQHLYYLTCKCVVLLIQATSECLNILIYSLHKTLICYTVHRSFYHMYSDCD